MEVSQVAGFKELSVVVPTVGRARLLEACLRSIRACDPGPAEVVVSEQSGGDSVVRLVADIGDERIRVVSDPDQGTASATNLGLRSVRFDHVLVTHDDCTVSTDWVAAGAAIASAEPDLLATGRVLPGGPPGTLVPSCKTDPVPRDYTNTVRCGVLFPNNMLVPRDLALELGGFDERVGTAEDNDFCYRWLRRGLRLAHRPELVVVHHDWRDDEALRRLYDRYGHGQGMFYAKQIREGQYADVAHLITYGAYIGTKTAVVAMSSGGRFWRDPRRLKVKGLIRGLREGWSTFAPRNQR